MTSSNELLCSIREAEARVLRRLMKVRATRPVYAEDPGSWLKGQLAMEIEQVGRDRALGKLVTCVEDCPESGGFYLIVSGGNDRQAYGPVLWHLDCARPWDVLSRRGIGYVLRHTDLL